MKMGHKEWHKEWVENLGKRAETAKFMETLEWRK
jgi:hypothetical protein